MIKHAITTTKIIIVFLLVTLYLVSFSLCLPENKKNEIQFNNDIMSASIHEVSIINILDIVRREKGIWYNEKTKIHDQKVTVYFNDLPVEKGLKRILCNFNYAFYFDEEQRIKGIIILGIKNKDENVEYDKAILKEGFNNNNPQEIIKEKKFLVFPNAGESVFP